MANQNIPKAIDLTITKEEMYGDIYKLMEDMSKIRFECINTGKVNEKNLEEYLQLSSFLAQALKAVSDKQTIDRLSFLVEEMNKSQGLVYFDPLQRRYWSRINPKFMNTLDTVLIQIYGNNFDSLDKGHHLISAVKYVCSKNEDSEAERKKILHSILPVSGRVRGVDPSTLFYGQMFHDELKEDTLEQHLNFDVGSMNEIVRRTMATAAEIGCVTFTFEAAREDYLKLKEEFPDMLPEAVGMFQGKQKVKVRANVNKAPSESESEHVYRKAVTFLAQKGMADYVKDYKPEELGKLMFNADWSKVEDLIYGKFERMFPKVDAAKLKEKSAGNLMQIASLVKEVMKTMHQYPGVYGFIVGDNVVINDMVTSDDNNDEKIWKGSCGEIIDICKTYSIEFYEPKIKKPKHGEEKKESKDEEEDEEAEKVTNSRIWDVSPEHLRKLENSGTVFPEWYKRGDFEIGDIVKLKKTYAEENEIEPGDITYGSVGRIIGLTYEIKFSKLVNKDGEVKEKDKKEDEINQVYLTRTNGKYEQNIAEVVNQLVTESMKESLGKKQKNAIDLKVHMAENHVGYSHHETIGGYDKCTLFFIKDGNYYLMSYVTESAEDGTSVLSKVKNVVAKMGLKAGEERINDDKIMEFVAGYKGLIRDAFLKVGNALNPIYISLHKYKEGKLVETFEGRR
jgi:hypothetical protein